MKYLLIICLTLMITAATKAVDTPKAQLIVTITHIRNHNGQLKIGVFNKPYDWMSASSAITGQNVLLKPVIGDKAKVTFTLPPGSYAIGLYHDENMNNKLDKNFLGIPKEDWGVSNNVHPHMRAPRFDEAHFILSPPVNEIEIALHR